MKKTQKVLNIKPTQFAVGMLEIDEKIKLVKNFKKKQLKEFIESTPVPVIVSPHGELYAIDHHHFLCVCYYVGIKKVRIKVIKDLSRTKLSFSQFWKWMHDKKNVYPYCQFGEGPRKALYLPKDVRGLGDDPYRSLAWFVRKSGAFENSEKNFAEFTWANFFRERGLLDRHGIHGMSQALIGAVKLALSPAAKGLPGYGKLNLVEKETAIKKAHKKKIKV